MTTAKSEYFQPLGSSGLQRYGGHIFDEPLRELQGLQGLQTLAEFALDEPIVFASLRVIEGLIRQVDWYIERGDATEEDAAFLEGVLFEDMSIGWEDFISEVLSMLVFGHSIFEIVYKQRRGLQKTPGLSSRFNDGRIGIRKLAIRAQTTLVEWDFDEHGGIRGVWQIAPPDYRRIYLPIERLLLFRTTAERGNPLGRSILRGAWIPYYYKRNLQRIEGIAIERTLAGFPIAWVPPEVLWAPSGTPEHEQYQAFVRLVSEIRMDERMGAVLPLAYDRNGQKKYDFVFATADSGSKASDTDRIITRYDQRIAMTLMTDFLLLGHEHVGSFALSSDKTNLLAVALGSVLDHICDVINAHLIPRLWRMNGFDVSITPRLSHGDIERPNVSELAQAIAALAGSGMPLWPDDEAEGRLRELLGLPPRGPDATPVPVSPQPPAPLPAMPGDRAGAGVPADSTAAMSGARGEDEAGQSQPAQPRSAAERYRAAARAAAYRAKQGGRWRGRPVQAQSAAD